MNRVAAFLVSLVLVAVLGLLIIAANWPVKDLPTEVVKSLLQLVVIAVAGHVVSILISKANNERQDMARAEELRNALLKRLNTAFVDVKRVRRIARATAEKVLIGDSTYLFIHKSRFHEYLQLINDAQLELELVSKDIESNAALFIDAKALIERLDKMEEYLNRLIDEYEHTPAKTVASPPDCFAVANFPHLGDLLGAYRSSQFRPHFVHAYYANLASIRTASSQPRRRRPRAEAA